MLLHSPFPGSKSWRSINGHPIFTFSCNRGRDARLMVHKNSPGMLSWTPSSHSKLSALVENNFWSLHFFQDFLICVLNIDVLRGEDGMIKEAINGIRNEGQVLDVSKYVINTFIFAGCHYQFRNVNVTIIVNMSSMTNV